MDQGLKIIETTSKDLENILMLWNDGEVMKYVGFPEGLGVSIKMLRNKWFPNINVTDKRKHYSIYHNEIGYCGECYYSVDDFGKAAMDIKLLSKARGMNIAFTSLKYALDQAFKRGHANICYVDPQKRNRKAISLYERLGFIELPHPDKEVGKEHLYFEISKDLFYKGE